MGIHFTFQHELTRLNKKLLKLSTLVEEKVGKATEVIRTRDTDTIRQLIVSDYQVDEMEMEIEEECLKILALHQPVARDLRFLIAVIKINNELERIADIAMSIAMRVDNISDYGKEKPLPYDFTMMSERVTTMLKKSVDSLIREDPSLARSVFLIDDTVDDARNNCYEIIQQGIKKNPQIPGFFIETYLLARHLERMADRAVNIAEEVIYYVEGTLTRNN